MCLLRIKAVGAQQLPHLISCFGGAGVGGLLGFFLRRNVELHDGGVWFGFVAAVGANRDGIGHRCDGAVLGEQRQSHNGDEKQNENGE